MTGRIERLQKEYGVQTRYTAFPLHPETPLEGRTLEELFAGHPVDMAEMMGRLRKAAAEEGLPFGDREKTYNSRMAQELGKWADSKDMGEPFHHGVFLAYFARGENIAQIPVLMDVVESVGLNPDEARRVLALREFKEAVDADWRRSRRMGVSVVPTFHLNGRFVKGAVPYSALEKLAVEQGVDKNRRSGTDRNVGDEQRA